MKSIQIVTIALLAILFVHANATTGTLSGSYRKDFYLEDYHESLKSYTTPTDGGRVNLVLQGSSCNLDGIKSQSIDSDIMPPGNLTGMTENERQKLAEWIKAGAPINN